MFKKIIISTSLALAFSLNAAALDDKEQRELVEQEFQSMDLDAEEISSDENSDGKFEFIDPDKQSTDVKKIIIKNEFFESVKIILIAEDKDAKIQTQEVYLNAYENKNSIAISRGVSYTVEVYNLYNKYLGQIYKANVQSKNKISISPFFLITDKALKETKPILVNEKAKEGAKQKIEIELDEVIEEQEKAVEALNKQLEEEVENSFRSITESTNFSSEIITHKDIEETKIFRETTIEKETITTVESTNPSKKEIVEKVIEVELPAPKENRQGKKKTSPATTEELKQTIYQANAKVRGIKVANISEEEIHIKLVDPLGQAIGGGWTISNDLYVPQFLNFKSEPIKIEADAKLLISNSKSKEIITKLAKDLNIDEKGNYVWFID